MDGSFQLSTDHSSRPNPRSLASFASVASSALPMPLPRCSGLHVQVFQVQSGPTAKRRERGKRQGQADWLAVNLGHEGLDKGAGAEEVFAKIVRRRPRELLQLLIDRQLANEVRDRGRIVRARGTDHEAGAVARLGIVVYRAFAQGLAYSSRVVPPPVHDSLRDGLIDLHVNLNPRDGLLQLLHALGRDPRPAQTDRLEILHGLQRDDSRVADIGGVKIQGLEVRQMSDELEALVGDPVARERQVLKLRQTLQRNQATVFQSRRIRLHSGTDGVS